MEGETQKHPSKALPTSTRTSRRRKRADPNAHSVTTDVAPCVIPSNSFTRALKVDTAPEPNNASSVAYAAETDACCDTGQWFRPSHTPHASTVPSQHRPLPAKESTAQHVLAMSMACTAAEVVVQRPHGVNRALAPPAQQAPCLLTTPDGQHRPFAMTVPGVAQQAPSASCTPAQSADTSQWSPDLPVSHTHACAASSQVPRPLQSVVEQKDGGTQAWALQVSDTAGTLRPEEEQSAREAVAPV